MNSRRRTMAHWVAILSIALTAAACSSGSDEPAGNEGSLIGVIDGGEITAAPDEPAGGTTEPAVSAPTAADCEPDEVCRIEVPLIEIILDATPSSISIDGDRAWLAAPDAMSVIEVDLVAATVAQTIAVDGEATDVVAGAGSLWVVTYDFSFGPTLRIDPNDGSLLATIEGSGAAPAAIAILDDAAWAVVDGNGRVARIDLATNEVTDVVGGSEITSSATEVAIVAYDGVAWAINQSDGSVERINSADRTIDTVVGDLGYSEEPSGEFTSILSEGATALAVAPEGVWVISDTPNPTDEVNVIGGAALFLLDAISGDVIRQIDLAIEPAFSRGGLAITENAAWYIGFVDRYPIRVDLDTGQQTFVSLNNASAVGVATDGPTVWFVLESLFDTDSVVGVDSATAAAAAAVVDQ